ELPRSALRGGKLKLSALVKTEGKTPGSEASLEVETDSGRAYAMGGPVRVGSTNWAHHEIAWSCGTSALPTSLKIIARVVQSSSIWIKDLELTVVPESDGASTTLPTTLPGFDLAKGEPVRETLVKEFHP